MQVLYKLSLSFVFVVKYCYDFCNSTFFCALKIAFIFTGMQTLHFTRFRQAIMLTAVMAIIILGCSSLIGKNELFLLLNGDLGTIADHFFPYCTYLGDGIIWVPVVILMFIYRRDTWVMIIASIIISTIITHIFKDWLMPYEPRPIKAITDTSLIHLVPGVEVNTVSSFPSGHTTTAFSIFLLACLLIPKKWVLPAGFFVAMLVGYSRIYLAQHFPRDVGAGMIAGIITAIASVYIQQQVTKRKLKKNKATLQ